ncbi:ferric reductase like transmembrane component [Xylaria nigripes]|nr:ferric reductase like transmembrane component [Xylaria nigripes]
MGWPYQFLNLDTAQLEARRHKLDRYGLIAQLSALVPVALFLLYRLVAWGVARVTGSARGSYAAVPSSPVSKQERSSLVGSWATRARRVAWWFGDDVVLLGRNWGPRDQIIAGVGWGIWLFVLCVVDTGNDYIHLSRRFTIVAVSQFPVQYLLSLKSLNPFALAFNSSHEQVNRWHRVLGRVIYIFFVLHVMFYINFYYQNNLLKEKFTSLVPVLGLILITTIHLLYGTALSAIRAYSYRVFFITHVVAILALPPLIYFHAHHASLFVWESLVVILVDIANRRFSIIVAETKVELIPGTDLIKLVGSVPKSRISQFTKSPGTHVYISVPAASRPNKNPLSPNHLIFEAMFNPFSVAAVDESSGELNLVAKRHNGPMTRAFAKFAGTDATVKLAFDGPYGCAKRFPNLAGPEFDRILLVAGGVGATFILPLYRWILSENAAARVQMVWAVRGSNDAMWPITGGGKSIVNDENIQLFITGGLPENRGTNERQSLEIEDVELSNLSENPRLAGDRSTIHGDRRPDLQKIVDDTFRFGAEERVAVLVCGPESMAQDLRSHVGVWVRRGRYVWWHSENFAW